MLKFTLTIIYMFPPSNKKLVERTLLKCSTHFNWLTRWFENCVVVCCVLHCARVLRLLLNCQPSAQHQPSCDLLTTLLCNLPASPAPSSTVCIFAVPVVPVPVCYCNCICWFSCSDFSHIFVFFNELSSNFTGFFCVHEPVYMTTLVCCWYDSQTWFMTPP